MLINILWLFCQNDDCISYSFSLCIMPCIYSIKKNKPVFVIACALFATFNLCLCWLFTLLGLSLGWWVIIIVTTSVHLLNTYHIRVEFRSNYMVKNYSLLQCSTAMRMIIIDDYIVRLIKTVESLFFPPKTNLNKPLEM